MPRTQADSARRPTYIIVPYNGKIADITETDTNKHTLDLATALSESRKIIAVILNIQRTGTGFLKIYPDEGAREVPLLHYNYSIDCVIADGTQRLQYAQSVANDDFDLYCMGYVVEV